MANNRTSIEVSASGEFSQLTRGLREVKGALSDVTSVVDKGAKGGGIFDEKQVRALDIFSSRFNESMQRMNKLMDDQSKKLEELYSRRRKSNSLDINAIDKEIKKHGDYLDALEQEQKELQALLALRQKEANSFIRPGGAPGGVQGPGRGPGAGPGSPGAGGNGGSGRSGGINVQITGINANVVSQLQQLLNRVNAKQDSPIVQQQLQRYRDRQVSSDNGPSTNDDGTSSPSPVSSSGSGTGAMAAGGALGALGKGLKSMAGMAAGIAGLSMGIGQLMKWEQMAEQREEAWQPLLQRTGMNRTAAENIGNSNGYNSFQTQQALDIYTQEAGKTSLSGLNTMQQFSRGYGVDLNTTAAMAGQFGQLGYGSPGTALNNVAGSAEASNMVPRMVEVMQEQLGFLQSMDKSLKDNSGNNLMAYTTRLNQIGQENGAQKLTGTSGGTLLQQMGSNIFSPSNTTWQAMGMQMLSKYGGKATKGMDSFGLMEQWQKGFQDPTNMKVFGSYLSNATKGMDPKQAQEFKTLTLQNAMGGDTTLQQAGQFGQMTNWLQDFNPGDPKMKKLLKGGNSPTNTSGVGAASQITQKDQKWNGTLDAKIEITNAKWMQAQLEAGKILIPAKLQLEKVATQTLNTVTGAANGATGGKGLNWPEMLGIGAGLLFGPKLLKGGAKKLFGIGGKGGKVGPKGGGRGGGGLPEEEPTSGGTRAATTAAEEGAVEGESGLYNALRKGGGKLLKTVGKTKIGRTVVGGAIISHMLMNEASPLYKNTVGQVVKHGGQALHGLVRAGANVTHAAPGLLGKGLKGALGLARRVPLVGGLIDTAYNRYVNHDSWGKASAGGAGGILGGMGGAGIGALIGGGIGTLIAPGVGTAAGALVGGGIGSLVGGIAGNHYGRKAYDAGKSFFQKPTDSQAEKQQTQYIKTLSDKGTLVLSNLDKKGAQQLATLSKEGVVTINGQKNLTVAQIQQLNKNGQLQITSLNTKGAKSLANLENKGEVSLSQFNKNAVSTIESASNHQKLDVKALSDAGQKQLDTLQKQGLIKIGGLQKDGTHQITVLKKGGAAALADLQSKGEINLSSMDTTTSKKLKDITTTHEDLAKSMKKATASGWTNLQTSFTSQLSQWWKDLKSFFHIGDSTSNVKGNDSKPVSQNQKDIKSELDSQGYGQYWNVTKKLLGKETGGGKNMYGATDPNDGQTPSGYFQFKNPTWQEYSGKSGAAINYSLKDQTDAFIKYVIGRYGSFENMVKKTGLNNGTYKGYANGTYVAADQVAKIHAGEEIVGRSKTQETLRKTGKLPSQVLNDVMNNGTPAAIGAQSGGAKDINLNINLTADQNMNGLPAQQVIDMIKSVLQTSQFQKELKNVMF